MTTATRQIEVEVFRAPQGCVAYLMSDISSKQALVLDPRLDQVDLLIDAAASKGVKIRTVLDR